ncbi:heat shock factor 2-binding protein-like isoform X1 [Ostrea edulis]|uniref:heat shock factor 2-binding protein-like isoform X1 n=1 Tax=Ostrea edulis TaxID=37623 RepID=UPI0024AF3403|nr:heat shock factor 2-binding protein-like isoform X1 [Ostrea edulis]
MAKINGNQINKESENTLSHFVSEVNTKHDSILASWEKYREENIEHQNSAQDLLLVSRDDLSRLVIEIQKLTTKSTKPKSAAGRAAASLHATETLKDEIKQIRQQNQSNLTEISYLRTRCETAVAECQLEKQENIRLRHKVDLLTQQLSQQSEYCSSLGSACCTLLWRVSRNEDTIQSILIGRKVEEFLTLVSNTLSSYVMTYKSDWPDVKSDESQFVHALCGIITNIAASAFGRDFLINNPHGCLLIDTYIIVLEEAPTGKSSRLKNLILMGLYNVSINQSGIKYLSSKRGMMKLLAWLLQDEVATENQVNTLKLIQSMMSVDGSLNIIHELLEELPQSVLQEFQSDKNREIRELAKEIFSDIQNHVRHEQ